MKILQDKLIKRITKNSGIVFFGNTLASVLSVISFAIIAKQLGPEPLAILVLAQTYALIINDIFNIQTWESMIKFGAAELKKDGMLNVIKTNIALDFVSALIALVFALLMIKPVAYLIGWDSSFLNVISLYSVSIVFNITTLTIGVPRLFNEFSAVARIQVVVAMLKLGGVLIAMQFGNLLTGYIYIYLFCDMLANFLLILYSVILLRYKYGKALFKIGFKINRSQIRFIWWTNLRTIMRIPVRHFDMVVISSVMSIEMVGIYKVYKEVASIINRIGEPINQSIYPEFTKLLGNKDIITTINITKNAIYILLGVGAVITTLIILTSDYIIINFFGLQYLEHINALYLMLIFFGVSFVTVPINSLFIAAGFAKYSFFIVLLTNSIYLVSAFFLGKYIGIYGLIYAFAIQLFINKGMKIFYLNKYSNDWGTVVR